MIKAYCVFEVTPEDLMKYRQAYIDVINIIGCECGHCPSDKKSPEERDREQLAVLADPVRRDEYMKQLRNLLGLAGHAVASMCEVAKHDAEVEEFTKQLTEGLTEALMEKIDKLREKKTPYEHLMAPGKGDVN